MAEQERADMIAAHGPRKATQLLLDMDGVLADFEDGFWRAWRTSYPDLCQLDERERRSHKIIEELPLDLRPTARKLYLREGFYRNLRLVSGAENILDDLMEWGLQVWICTCPVKDYPQSILEKYEWIEAHYGRKWTDRIIVTRDKTLVLGDVLIDDAPIVSGAATPQWTHLVFDAPYNKSSPAIRVDWNNWKAVVSDFVRAHR